MNGSCFQKWATECPKEATPEESYFLCPQERTKINSKQLAANGPRICLTDTIICWLSIYPRMIKKQLSLTVTFFFVQKTERGKGFILQTTSSRQCVSISPLASSSAASRPMRPEGGQEERLSREFLKQNTMF